MLSHLIQNRPLQGFQKSSQTLHNSLNGWDQGAGDPSNSSIPSTTVPPQSLKCYFIKICYAIGQVLRGYAQDDKLSLLLSTLVCVSSCVCSKILGQNRQRRTGCICLTFLHCAFSNVSSNRLPERMQSHNGCICSAFLRYAFSNVPSNGLPERMQTHTVFYLFDFAPLCVFKCLLKLLASMEAYPH